MTTDPNPIPLHLRQDHEGRVERENLREAVERERADFLAKRLRRRIQTTRHDFTRSDDPAESRQCAECGFDDSNPVHR